MWVLTPRHVNHLTITTFNFPHLESKDGNICCKQICSFLYLLLSAWMCWAGRARVLDHANVLMSEDVLQELFLSFHYVTAKDPSWSTGLEGTDGILPAPKDTDLTCLCKCYTLQEALNKGIAVPLLSNLFCFLFLILFLP